MHFFRWPLDGWRPVEAFWTRNTRRGGQFWTHNLNERVGALIANSLLRTRVTPNMVTLTGLGLHVATAIYLVSARRPLPLSSVVVVLVGWQLAFSLDCADGQLARARSQANPFGAWLDQIADFISHTAVFLAFGIFLTRTLRLEAVDAVIAVTIIFGANILQLFASAERNALFGADEGIHGDTRRWIRILALARHLSDYGATLLISSLLLMAPEALLVFLLIASVLSGGLVFSQVGYGWMRRAGAG